MQQYNYQIRPTDQPVAWSETPVHSRALPRRTQAVTLAKRLAHFYRAEIRLTTGNDAFRANGSYFHENTVL